MIKTKHGLKTLQEVYDFVQSFKTQKDGCKALGISVGGSYPKIKWLVENADIQNLKAINNGDVPYQKAYQELKNGKFLKKVGKDKLIEEKILSEKALYDLGKSADMSDFVSHVVRWGFLDIDSYIDHFMVERYKEQTQLKAISIHRTLMQSGHESNYCQMKGVFAYLMLMYELKGSITDEDRKTVKQGCFCPKDKR